MLTTKKSTIEAYMIPLVKSFARVNPNTLTLLGSIPPVLFFVFVFAHHFIIAEVALLGSSVDLLDGLVARTYGKVTKFGGFFDSTIDRIADFLFITAFAFAHIVRWELVAPFLLFSFLTSYTRSRGELASGGKLNFAVGILERTERLIGIFLALLFYLLNPAFRLQTLNPAELVFLLLTILSVITVTQRII